jgi:hypothetical protein
VKIDNRIQKRVETVFFLWVEFRFMIKKLKLKKSGQLSATYRS